MPIDWLTLWGVTQAAGFLFKPVLEALAEDAVKDIAKDKIKESFGSVFKAVSKDTLTKAYGKAVKELLQLIQDELIANDIAEAQVEAWNDDVKLFIRSQGVQQTLRRAFSESSSPVDAGSLAQSWQRMPNGPHPLPSGFNWPRIAKLFSLKVRNIREEENELRDILTAQASAETAEAIQNQTGVAPDFDLEKYREALLETHQHLKLELLDHTGSAYKIQLRSVFVPQTVRDCQEYIPQVFEIPKEHLLRLRKAGGLDEAMLDLAEGMQEELIDVRRRSYLDQSPRSVLEIVRDDHLPRLVMLGSPGSGKSTLLKALALEWAQEPDATERAARPVPLFIELREYDRWDCPNGKSFVRFLHEAQITCRLNQGRLDEVLQRRGGAVLLLDGLDEIFDQNRRNDALNDIHRFSNDYPDTPVIVTSRIIGYQQRRLSDAGFRHFMLQDLEDAQIAEFLDRWHQTFVAEARERETKRRRLAEAISESRAIRELADNPLLLTMMSILNLHQELPRDRVQLYEQASRVLLHQWDVERLGLKVTIDYKEKAEMLRRLALEMQSAPGGLKGNIIAGDKLEALFRDYFKQELEHPDPRNAAREMAQQLRERNYILCQLGQDNFAFVHRTLLEYFCASALVRQSLREESSLEFLKQQVFAPHWWDESWHEVLRLIAGMDDQLPVEHVAEIIDFLLEEKDASYKFYNVFLAANCCLEVRNTKSLGQSRTRVTGALLRLVRFDFPYVYEDYEDEARRRNEIHAKAARFLANPQLFDQAHSWIKERSQSDEDRAVRQAAVQELARGWKDHPDTLLWLKDRATKDDEWRVRQAAVQELARGWKDHPDTLPWLKDRVAKDDDQYVRQAAVQELVRGWKDHPETLPWLKDRIAKEKSGDVRQAAVQELARGWKDYLDTLLILKDCAAKDDFKLSCVNADGNFTIHPVRQAAVQELARGWKDHPDTLPWLKDRAAKDENESVRQAAVQEMVHGWKDDPDTLHWLKDRVAKDENWAVRKAAVQELVRGWKNDPDTLPWLKDRVAKDDHSAVRKVAVQELARGWKDHPDTLLWLKDRATKDDEWRVRQAAVWELARGWKDRLDILLLLKDRAAKDDNESVRYAVVVELARGWKDHPDTLPWLKDRAAKDDSGSVREAVVEELARGWKDHPDTLPWLKDRAAKDDNESVRQAAVRELVRGWKDHPETLPWLKDRAAKDDSEAVRKVTVQGLARGWKDDPETLLLLKACATQDDNEGVRQAAVQELARGWKDDPETLSILKARATQDDNWDVRQVAVQELARGWKDDPETLSILKARATQDDNWDVRQAAVQELARGWKDDPETLLLLKACATQDDNWDVRQAAVQELARGWKDDPETLLLLKACATQDDNWDVRQAAVQELAHGWKDDPDTLPWLKGRAVNDPSPAADAEDDRWINGVRDNAIQAIFRGWPNDPGTLPLLRERAENDPTPWLREKAKRLADEIEARG